MIRAWRLKKVFLILLIVAINYPSTVLALSAEQKKLFQSGVYYFDVDEDLSACGSGQTLYQQGGFDPVSMRYPKFPDEAKIASDLTAYISRVQPSSPLLRIPDLGNWLLQAAKPRDVNPLFVFVSAAVESQFGTSPLGRNNNNFFGIKSSGSGYRSFGSPQEGVEYFLDDLKENTQGGDSIYSKATNIYEYFSIHQTGSIVYPGEDFDPNDVDKDGNTKDLYDPAMRVWISWDPNKNPNGAQYTPLIYYKNNINLLNDAFGLNIPADNPTRGGSVACAGPSSGGNGALDTSGYSFPLAPQTKAIGGIKVGQTTTMHHDKTPAFDLFSPIESASVYALYGGTPIKVNPASQGVAGCTSIQFLADDGFYYYYDHMKNASVQVGVHIDAGTKMADVADQSFGSKCFGGGPHLHIDRGCITSAGPQTAGRASCRDPAFIPFLSQIFERLGD